MRRKLSQWVFKPIISSTKFKSLQEHDIKTLFGRKVAIDASMSIYQFLIAVRQKDGDMLTNDAGETTRHVSLTFRQFINLNASVVISWDSSTEQFAL